MMLPDGAEGASALQFVGTNRSIGQFVLTDRPCQRS